jgi:hypothetical protein
MNSMAALPSGIGRARIDGLHQPEDRMAAEARVLRAIDMGTAASHHPRP